MILVRKVRELEKNVSSSSNESHGVSAANNHHKNGDGDDDFKNGDGDDDFGEFQRLQLKGKRVSESILRQKDNN